MYNPKMTSDIDRKIIAFSNAIGVDPVHMITYIHTWSCGDARLAMLSDIKNDYVDECIIGNKSIDEFMSNMKEDEHIRFLLNCCYQQMA